MGHSPHNPVAPGRWHCSLNMTSRLEPHSDFSPLSSWGKTAYVLGTQYTPTQSQKCSSDDDDDDDGDDDDDDDMLKEGK